MDGSPSSSNIWRYNGVAKENWQPGCKRAVQTAGGHWLNSSMEVGEIGVIVLTGYTARCAAMPRRFDPCTLTSYGEVAQMVRAPDSTQQPCCSRGVSSMEE